MEDDTHLLQSFPRDKTPKKLVTCMKGLIMGRFKQNKMLRVLKIDSDEDFKTAKR